ncbi:MAG: hypothetical protein KJ000_22055 [Pirellulaceae bacterium]|nr:hypothetical protein [Pirellulaceae bacterium]
MPQRPTVPPHLVVCLLIAFSWARTLTGSDPHPSLPRSGTVDGLGVNIHFTDPRPGEMEMLTAGGFRWVRMDLIWSATERERGRYDFSAYDRLVAALEEHRIRALFILDYSNRLYEDNRSVVTEEGRRAYARWAASAAERFQGKGILWEIWNEPNIRNFWQPEPNMPDYTAMALAACRAIREAAPGEAIIGPATSTIDLPFLEGCFQAGLLEWWDAVSVHPYRQSAPETAVAEYRELRRLIAKYAPAKRTIPILSAEWGYSAVWNGFDADKQGRMLSRQWLTNLAHDIPLSIWYDWRDDGLDPKEPEHHFGTVAHQYRHGSDPVFDPKPAYLAAKTLSATFAGCQFDKRLATGRQDEYALLFRQGDRFRLAAWTTSAAPRRIEIAASDGRFEVVSHTGQHRESLRVEGGKLSLTVSEEPQFLIAVEPNPGLASAPAAHPLQAQLIPGPGKWLTVQLDNPAEVEFRGMVRLVDTAGIDLLRSDQPVELKAGEMQRSLRFPLTAAPAGSCRAGLRIEDSSGRSILVLPARRFERLPDEVLATSRIVADGDSRVDAELSIAVAPAPEPLPGSDSDVLRVSYRFEAGWKFLKVDPTIRDLTRIDGQPAGFGIWIYGDGQNASPRLRVRDGSGQTWQPSGRSIDWRGWQYVELPLDTHTGHWGGAADGVIHFPLTWESIFLLDNPSRKSNSGTVYVAAPVVLY